MLPNVENKEDIEALSNALEEVFKPVLGEILDTIKKVREAYPDKSDAEFLKNALQYSMEALQESVDKMTKGKAAPKDDKQILTLIEGLKNSDEEFRKEIVAELLSNRKMQTAILGGVNREILDAMNAHLAELVGAAEAEKKLREDEKKRADEERREKNRDKANTKARTQAKKPAEGTVSKALSAIPDTLNGLVKAFQDIGLALGAFGLFSMLPKKIQEVIGDFTATFTYVRKLMEMSFLKPLLKLFEAIPGLGLLIKKIPMLNMIIAAFEIIPKVLKSFNKDGLWAAVETGLKAVYDFFVGDVLALVGKFADWIQEKLFGKVFLNFENAVGQFNEGLNKWIGNFMNIWKSVFAGDWKGALKNVGKLVTDGIDNIVNTVLTLFSLPADWNTEEKLGEIMGAVSNLFNGVKQWIVNAAAGIGKFVTDGINFLMTSISDRWNAAISAVGDFVDSTKQFASNLWNSFTTSLSNAWNGAISEIVGVGEFVTGLFDSVKNWIVDSWNAGLQGIEDFGTTVADTISSIWTGITDKIATVFTDAISGLTQLKDEMSKWFTNMVKKTVNSIIDQLPSWMGTDALRFNIDEEPAPAQAAPATPAPEAARPMAQSERRMVTQTQAAELARRAPAPSRGGPTVNVRNNNNSSSTTFSLRGPTEAHTADPLGRR